MARLASLLSRLPLRALFQAVLAAYLTFIGMEAFTGIVQEPIETSLADGKNLAMFGSPSTVRIEPQSTRIPVGVPLDLRELRQTYEILGIICRTDTDRSVFVRDVASGDERIYRVGDSLNGTVVSEIHPTYIVLTAGGSRTVLSLFAREPQPSETEEI